MPAFAREQIRDLLQGEAMPLLVRHWREIAHYPDIALDPDIARYEAAEVAGMMRCFTVRNAGALVGYGAYCVGPALHYRGSLQAHQDVLYLEPSQRGGAGLRLIRWCDEQLAAEGVQVVHHHVKAAHNFGPVLERIGYELTDLIYSRRLDKLWVR